MVESDFEVIKNLYPRQVTGIRYMVEDICDQLEYEGSPMFAEIPDATTVQELAKGIYKRVAKDEDRSVPCESNTGCIPPYVPPCKSGNCLLRQLIEVMLLDEMHYRRNRYWNRKNRY